MKQTIYILLAILVLSCNPKNIDDCLKTTGDIEERTVEVPFFDKVIAQSRVKLFVQSGAQQSVVVRAGENLQSNVELSVNAENTLLVENNEGCNIFRDFEQVEVYVTSPNLTQIRNGSGYAVESIGVLNFQNLELISEDSIEEDEFNTDGDFILEVNCETLRIVNNNITNYFLSGTVDIFDVNLFNGDGRVDAPNLIAQDINFLHRGSNKMIINPQNSLTGVLRSTGDVIAVNRPPNFQDSDVEQLFTGRLIFQ